MYLCAYTHSFLTAPGLYPSSLLPPPQNLPEVHGAVSAAYRHVFLVQEVRRCSFTFTVMLHSEVLGRFRQATNNLGCIAGAVTVCGLFSGLDRTGDRITNSCKLRELMRIMAVLFIYPRLLASWRKRPSSSECVMLL